MFRTRVCIAFGLLCVLIAQPAIAAEGRLVEDTFHSVALEGNLLGDSPDRNVTIYLPPGYDENPDMRYPTVYLLHGYTGTNRLWTGSGYIGGLNIKNIADALIEQGKMKPLIFVAPNARNSYLGSWYTNSSVTGNWEDFVTQELVEYIDSTYRTLPEAARRGMAGHSMGGYGAIKLAMKYPEIYSAVYALSAANVVLEEEVLKDGRERILSVLPLTDITQFDELPWLMQGTIAAAAAFTPNPNNAPFFADFPLEEVDGEVRVVDSVWQRWLQHDPFTLIDVHREDLL